MMLRQAWVAIRVLVVMTVVVGILYPVAIFAVGRLVPDASNGSYATDGTGAVVGSALIGQEFTGDEWFWSRPSAAGEGYDALSSGGSNLAADNPALVEAVAQRQSAIAEANGIDAGAIPADAVTASGSGLDPHISPEYAYLQAPRVAAARGIDPAVVSSLVADMTEGRLLGFIGEPRVNVLRLNLAVEELG